MKYIFIIDYRNDIHYGIFINEDNEFIDIKAKSRTFFNQKCRFNKKYLKVLKRFEKEIQLKSFAKKIEVVT